MKEYWTIKNKKSGSWWCRASCFTSQKHARGTYTHRVHALEAMISIIQDCPDIEKDVTLVRVTVKTKPRGAKVGTWAWACEQMLDGKPVRLPGWGLRKRFAQYKIAGDFQLCSQSYGSPYIPESPRASDFKATDWELAL